jgi:hypothetical protein
LVLPQLDLVLVFSKNVLRVTRRPAKPSTKPELVGEIKLTALRGKVQPIAVYAAPEQRVLVIALRETSGPPTASASVTHFEVIDVFR